MPSCTTPASSYEITPACKKVYLIWTMLLTLIGCYQIDPTLPTTEQLIYVLIVFQLILLWTLVFAVFIRFLYPRFSTIQSSADPTIPIVWSHKTEATCRSERLAKYNQLLRIEEELGDRPVYAGAKFRNPSA